jgi:type IV pilus assembly protein PilM
MKLPFLNNTMPIGLDIGEASLKMLQLAPVENGFSVVASGEYELPHGLPADGPEYRTAVIDGIAKLRESYPFRGRDVVSCLPVGLVQFKNVRMPKMPPEELRSAIAFEAAERFELEGQSARVEHLFAGEVRHGDDVRDEVILMAAPDSVLRRHIELLSASGLRIEAIDATPSALARCFGRFVRRESDANIVKVFVDIGRSCSKIMIMRGQRVVFFKLIDIGGSSFDRAVSEHLKLSLSDAVELRRRLMGKPMTDEDADQPLFGSNRRQNTERAVYEATRSLIGDLAREIGLCLRYYSVTFRGARPDHLCLIGGEAREAQLTKGIAEGLGMEVSVAEPMSGIDLHGTQIHAERRGNMPEWAVATGLALRSNLAVTPAKRGAA